MELTGHKSSASLEIDQRVHSTDKMRMGHTLGLTLIALPPAIQQKEKQDKIEAPHQPLLAIQAPPPALPTINLSEVNNIVTLPYNQNTIPRDQEQIEDSLGIPDDQLVQIIQEYEQQNEEIIIASRTKKFKSADGSACVSNQVVKKSSPRVPAIFSGCKIDGNIHIHIHE